MEYTNTTQCRNVVSKWKSEHSAFQNTKNLWNRCIIRDVRRIFVLKSRFGVISRVFEAYMHAYTVYACMYASNTREMTPKLDFNTKIFLTSRIMHRFQRFLMFWKAEGLLFHLETTFPRCFVFVRSKTSHLWKVCLIYWTNAGSSIPVLDLEGYDYGDISANIEFHVTPPSEHASMA